MIETHDEIQWEYCPVPTQRLHGRYRGFDLHRWGLFSCSPMVCLYPSEGEASKTELIELRNRVPYKFRSKFIGTRYTPGIRDGVQSHEMKQTSGEVCLQKERFDGLERNYCLELYGITLESQLTLLDEIIDALWQQSGLNAASETLPVGQWR